MAREDEERLEMGGMWIEEAHEEESMNKDKGGLFHSHLLQLFDNIKIA